MRDNIKMENDDNKTKDDKRECGHFDGGRRGVDHKDKGKLFIRVIHDI